ncbi:MAG: N-acetyltransferase [Ignavibacteriales bacterium]|nr:MAG: N-acetyltransferase [Ignavibacteriales bacterium]
MMNPKIIHDAQNHKFYCTIEGKESYLRYFMKDATTIDLRSTYVPHDLRGKGIAGSIAETALNFALENNLTVIPTCSYVHYYMQKNDKYKELITRA